MYIRQGDILFKKIDGQIEGKSQKNLIVAEGEATGHHHTLVAEASSEIIGDRTKFQIKGKARLTHQEHDAINFLAGTYVVINEREFDYIEQTLTQVKD